MLLHIGPFRIICCPDPAKPTYEAALLSHASDERIPLWTVLENPSDARFLPVLGKVSFVMEAHEPGSTRT
jgi:hypothetical protein